MTGNGTRRRPERLQREVQHHDRVLAAREQQHRPLELGRDLADDVIASSSRWAVEVQSVAVVRVGRRSAYRNATVRSGISAVDHCPRSWRAVTVTGRSACTPDERQVRVRCRRCRPREPDRGPALELAELSRAGPPTHRHLVAGQLGDDRLAPGRSLCARAVTSVGSQPVLAMPTSTRHVPSPSAVDAGGARSPGAARRAPGTPRTRRAGATSSRSRAAAGWSRRRGRASRRARPGRAAGGRTGTSRRTARARARRSSAARRAPARRSGRVYQKCVDCFVPVAGVDDVPELGRPASTRRGARRPSRRRPRSSCRLVPREVLEHRVRPGSR